MAKTLEAVDIPLDDDQRAHLQKQVYEQLSAAIAVHAKREEKLRELSLAYSAKPKHAVKNFPWPNASNLVIPIVAITVDNVVARLMKSFLGVSNPIECIIKSPSVEFQEKDFRDWANRARDVGLVSNWNHYDKRAAASSLSSHSNSATS